MLLRVAFLAAALAPRPLLAVHLPAAGTKPCLNAGAWWEKQLDMKFGLGRNSQSDQDARLMSLFDILGDTTKFYVEFGYTGLDNSQSERLRLEKNFTGFRMGYNFAHPNLTGCSRPPAESCHSELVTGDNIESLFRKYGSPKEPDYVSIDIDSVDVWVFGNLTKSFRPRVFTVEYSAGRPLSDTVARDHQSSLGAVARAARESGYTLVGVEPSLDAFLVRSDLVCKGTEAPLATFAKFTEIRQGPLYGLPKLRRGRGCAEIGPCPVEWTLREFPCDPEKHSFCLESSQRQR